MPCSSVSATRRDAASCGVSPASGESRVSEHAGNFRLSLNTVSKHIKVLERSRLVQRRSLAVNIAVPGSPPSACARRRGGSRITGSSRRCSSTGWSAISARDVPVGKTFSPGREAGPGADRTGVRCVVGCTVAQPVDDSTGRGNGRGHHGSRGGRSIPHHHEVPASWRSPTRGSTWS